MSRDVTVLTGLDPVIHRQCSDLEGDDRNKSGHDDWGSRDFALPASMVVRL